MKSSASGLALSRPTACLDDAVPVIIVVLHSCTVLPHIGLVLLLVRERVVRLGDGRSADGINMLGGRSYRR
jgi:hypothetical protein